MAIPEKATELLDARPGQAAAERATEALWSCTGLASAVLPIAAAVAIAIAAKRYNKIGDLVAMECKQLLLVSQPKLLKHEPRRRWALALEVSGLAWVGWTPPPPLNEYRLICSHKTNTFTPIFNQIKTLFNQVDHHPSCSTLTEPNNVILLQKNRHKKLSNSWTKNTISKIHLRKWK